jgi:monoterpene epsilon-lactone hydrolase
MPSLQSVFVKWFLTLDALFSGSPEILDVQKERFELDKMGRLFKTSDNIKFIPIALQGLYAEWVIPENLDTKRTILYFHGGSYLAGSISSHRGFVADLAISAKARALIVEYHLAPEFPFPAALEDAMMAYDWLIEKGTSPGNVIVAGDSAGGGLTLALLIHLRDQKKELPAMAICLSPWTNLAVTGESVLKNAKKDIILNSKNLKKAADLYLNGEAAEGPLASPMYADFTGIPPLLIQAGSDEILLSDSISLAAKAKADGVDVTLEIFDGMQHVWQFAGRLVPEAWKAILSIGTFIDRRYL